MAAVQQQLSIPVGTRGIGYLTKLPQLDEHNFEETFSTWEFEVGRYKRDTTLPDNGKIAILLKEAIGALQQYLQLQAGATARHNGLRPMILE